MLQIPIRPQPSETTCGPTCLHAIYEYYNNGVTLDDVITGVDELAGGGTLGVYLAINALKRGYSSTIFSYNLNVFDPTWSSLSREELIGKLTEQLATNKNRKIKTSTKAYIRYLELGGTVRFDELRSGLIRRYLKKDQPLIAGLSATYLYKSAREYGPDLDYDDVRGEPSGHFVVLHGYEKETREIYIADPLSKNPLAGRQFYSLPSDRVLNAILLGIVSYDANLILIRPKKGKA
ncbi:MAG: C39 family peptidase [Balneolaceae bacterium]|nr:C39 family peptidase [Balneolaceae bacterium]MCH8548589.1 C39 family peptidase [Balneolaceae bacterium]